MSPPSPSFQTRSQPREGRRLTARGHSGGRGRPGTGSGAPPPDHPSLDAQVLGMGAYPDENHLETFAPAGGASQVALVVKKKKNKTHLPMKEM